MPLIPPFSAILGNGLFAVAISLVLTAFFAWLGKQWGLVDRPHGRKRHAQPVSYLGGLAICGTINIVLGMAGLSFLQERLLLLLVVDLMFVLGFIDDMHPLSPSIRLVIQGILALATVGLGVRIRFISLPGGMLSLGWIGIPMTVLWLMAMTNAMNFIDGLDGLAGGVALIASISLMVIGSCLEQWSAVVLLSILAGSLCGFIPLNLFPAKIFLGNGGAYFVGFLLGIASTLGTLKSPAAVVFAAPVIALGVPVLDTVWAMVRRMRGHRSLTRPDRSHIHHLLLQTGLSERSAVMILHIISFGLALIAVALIHVHWQIGGALIALVGIAGLFSVRKLCGMQLEMQDGGENSPRKG